MPPPVSGPTGVRAPTTNAPQIPEKAIDVSTIDVKSAEFRQLPAAYQRAVTDAKAYAEKSFKGMAPAPKVLVTPSSARAHGGQPVTMVIPPGAKEPLKVQTHYHGDWARSTSGINGATDQIAKNVKAGDTTVYVLPEAKSAGGKGTDWSNAGNIGATTDEALKHAGLSGDQAHRTISVHSAGGRALLKAVENGEQLKADQLVIQDALYDPTGTNLRSKLPPASAGVARITIQPTVETPHDDRTEALRKALKAGGRNVEVAPKVQFHAQAANQLHPPAQAAVPGRSDVFD
jgi:hypothetical protein